MKAQLKEKEILHRYNEHNKTLMYYFNRRRHFDLISSLMAICSMLLSFAWYEKNLKTEEFIINETNVHNQKARDLRRNASADN